MTRPTIRGAALIVVAVVTYVAARVLGVWELYVVAFAFLAAVGVSWALVLVSGRRLRVTRAVAPRQPVAGDPLVFSFRVENGSLIPGLQVTLPVPGGMPGDGASDGGTLVDGGALVDGGQLVHGGALREGAVAGGAVAGAVEVESLGSRSARSVATRPRPARRGVHRLSEQIAVAEDPLGLVRTRRRLGGALELTVVPRLTRLTSCALVADRGAHRGGDRRRLPTLHASEFHGIRPHNPGEPLNRVDWKATAKTGALMLREMEGSTGHDVTLLLNGPAGCAGGPREEEFELAVEAAGSIADYALRTGHEVTLLLPENDWRPVRLKPDAKSRRRLLTVLAGAAPRGAARLGPSVRAIVAGSRPPARTRNLTAVVTCLDRGLVQALVGLQKEGLPVSVVSVEKRERPPAARAAEGSEPRRALTAAGIRYVTLERSDELASLLSAGPVRRQAVAG